MKKPTTTTGKFTTKRKTIDWDHVYSQLRNAQQIIDKAESPTPQEQEQILKARAVTYSSCPSKDDTESELLEILEFQLGDENYGLDTSCVQEVVPLKDFTPVPGTPDYVFGLTSVRGNIYSVLDLKRMFQLPDMGLTDLNKLIIIHSGEMEFGILADRIVDVKRINKTGLRSSGQIHSGISNNYITGITTGHLIIIHAENLLLDYGKIDHE